MAHLTAENPPPDELLVSKAQTLRTKLKPVNIASTDTYLHYTFIKSSE